MNRHSTDLVGLVFGAAFALAGIGLLVHEATDTSVDPVWTAGLALIVLGVIALAGTLARGARRDVAPADSLDPSRADEPRADETESVTSDG